MTRFLMFLILANGVACSSDVSKRSNELPAQPTALSGPDALNLRFCSSMFASAAKRGRQLVVSQLLTCLPDCTVSDRFATTAQACGVTTTPIDVGIAEAAFKWIESKRGLRGGEDSLATIDKAREELVLAFDLPAASANVPTSDKTFEPTPRVLVRIDGDKMSIGGAPAATMKGGELAMLRRPFPGRVVTRATLRRTVSSVARALEESQGPAFSLLTSEGPNEADDGESDSGDGGTGTKMSLEDGKMGRKESSRKSGQFAMKDSGIPPELARQQALERARQMGLIGALSATAVPLVIADARTPAASVATVTSFLGRTRVAVADDGKLVAHAVELVPSTGRALTIQVNGDRILLDGALEDEIKGAHDGPNWWKLSTRLERSEFIHSITLDILPETSTGTMVRVLDLLAGLGVESVGIVGGDPFSPRAVFATMTTRGDLPKDIIRRYLDRRLGHITDCYVQQFAANTELVGEVVAGFVISPTGKPSQVATKHTGLNDDVATCVKQVIETLHFPRPRNSGTVSVSIPIRLYY